MRRAENKRLRAVGDERLKGTKYEWLRNPARFSNEAWRAFRALREADLKTARAFWLFGVFSGWRGPRGGEAVQRSRRLRCEEDQRVAPRRCCCLSGYFRLSPFPRIS